MTDRLPVARLQVLIGDAFRELERLCSSSSEANRLLARTHLAASDVEREHHRRFGARFTEGRAGYRASTGLAAKYFVLRWVLEGPTAPATWLGAAQTRDDVRLGYALREYLQADHYPVSAEGRPCAELFGEYRERHAPYILAIDYARDFAVQP